jgi:N-acetylglutamate synthase-like GNAT family acetyltransferase
MSDVDKIRIRRALETEGAALSDLSMRSKQSNGYDDAFMDACRDELAVTPERLRADEYWVADADGICGCASLSINHDKKIGVVHSFFVEPNLRGSGIGKLLWQKLHERAQTHGFEALVLDADPNAEEFYQNIGFVKVKDTPSGSIEGRLIPYMRLDLKDFSV